MSEKRTVLIVDDTPDNLTLISELLKNTYKTKVATGGAKALSIASSDSPPDLILLDIMMPEMDGYEVCRRLKENPASRDIPVIFLTAMNQEEDEQKGLEVGAVDYIVKPISPPILFARVNTHIRLKEANDLLKQQNDVLEKKVEERTKELSLLNSSMTRFVPNEFLSVIGHSNILNVSLGDSKSDIMTVLFMDIRSYTTMSENMTPKETFDFLNTYLGHIGPVIRECNGFVAHFFGDGLMAIFPGSPDEAVRAAVNIQRKVADYNTERTAEGSEPIRVGIGLNTGPVMLGIIGDGHRTDSAVVSDSVNTASRMEGLTKHYGVSIIASDTTYSGLENPEAFDSRLLEKVQVKGKKKVMKIYEIFTSDAAELFGRKQSSKPEFERGQALYFERRFADALKCFTDVAGILPEDITTKFYLERAAKFLLDGVADDWTGVRSMDKK